jgi:3-deoxy-manno-octulosonate cytidylyltransferase (CMP-KDO synthetase)
MLVDVVGLPLIIRVARQAMLSQAQEVIVATDHLEIMQVCQAHQVPVVMTRAEHQSGTDRIAEVVSQLGLADNEIIVNVQGDEPLIEPQLINQLAEFISLKQTAIATIAHPIAAADECFNPNIVKTVLNHEALAMYFSRAPIPYFRDSYGQINPCLPTTLPVLRHIGIYAYQVSFLQAYSRLPVSPLEQIESLEQLRALYYGYQIAVLTTAKAPAAGVDTQADLERVRDPIAAQEA